MTGLPLSVALSIDEHHPAFEGHFPSMPIVPGVVLLDRGLRVIAAHRGRGSDESRPTDLQTDQPVEHCRLGAAKFLSFVRPGEPVRLEIEPATSQAIECAGNVAFRLRIFAGRADDERLAVTGSVSFERVIASSTPPSSSNGTTG